MSETSTRSIDERDDVAADAPLEPSPTVRRGLLAVTVLPIVTAVVRAITSDWFPIGDSALLYIRTRDVLTEHHPWLGSWSSASISLGEHINNPGPIYDDLIAPFAHLFGPGVGAAVGVGAVNLVSVVGATVAARRIGGWMFERWILLASALLAWTMGSELLFDIFQAHALLLPFLLAIVLFVGVIDAQPWAWPWLAGVVSLLLQTHVSYAYIVVLLGIAGLTLLVARLDAPRRPALLGALRSRTAAITVVVLALLWIQPIIEQVFGEGRGNLARLIRNASGGDVAVGIRNAVKMVAAIVALPPWWGRQGFADTIVGTRLTDTASGQRLVVPGLPAGLVAAAALTVLVVALVLAALRANRRGATTLTIVTTIAVAGVVASVIALSRLTVSAVGFAPHHTRWVHVVALVVHVALAWTAVDLIVARFTGPGRSTPEDARPLDAVERSVQRTVDLLIAVVIVVVSGLNIPYFVHRQGALADVDSMPTMERLFDRLDRLSAWEPVLYRTDNLRVFEPYSSTFQSQLQARGIEFRVDEEIPIRQLGNGRRATGDEPSMLQQLEGWAALSYEGADCLLGRASLLDGPAEAALTAEAEILVDRLLGARLDLGAVTDAPDTLPADRELATSINAGDRAAIRHATYDGRLLWWADQGLLGGDADAIDELRERGPGIRDWVPTVVALVVSPAEACAG